VNSVCESSVSNLVASGGDDRTVKIWDSRTVSKYESMNFDSAYQVTSVVFDSDGQSVFSAGIDNKIYQWDLRMSSSGGEGEGRDDMLARSKKAQILCLEGHTDTISGLALSPDGTTMLSNSMDNTLKSWDIQSFCSGERELKTFKGVVHNAEKRLLKCCWSPDGEMVSAGSSDNVVHVWDYLTSEELYALPGHKGGVCDVQFRPGGAGAESSKNVIASGGADKNIILGEL
jgi:Prp8 binding protein